MDVYGWEPALVEGSVMGGVVSSTCLVSFRTFTLRDDELIAYTYRLLTSTYFEFQTELWSATRAILALKIAYHLCDNLENLWGLVDVTTEPLWLREALSDSGFKIQQSEALVLVGGSRVSIDSSRYIF